MNEHMHNLLELASDDEGSPLGFSGETVVRRGQARRRRRRGGTMVALAAAVVTGALVVPHAAGLSHRGSRGPTAAGPGTSAPTTPSASTKGRALNPNRNLSPLEQTILTRCAGAPMPRSVRAHDSTLGLLNQGTSSSSAQGRRTAGFLRSWTLDAHVQDAQGFTATFVDAAHAHWASCQLASGGSGMDDEVVPMGVLPSGPIPHTWYGPDGFRHQGATVDWAQVCAPGEGKVCGREVFAGALARYAGVAAAVVDAPDGTVLHPVFGDYTYVFRHVEDRVDPNRPSGDMQTMPSMPVTLLDAQGKQVIHYDYFPSYPAPGSCPASGGC